MLTALEVRQAKLQATAGKLFDGGGLFLHVMPSGGKLWRLKYRFGGKEKLLALGRYPEVDLAAARAAREAAKRLLSQGVDPSEQRKDARRAKRAQRDNTFRAMADAWYAKKTGEWSTSTRDKVRRYLDRDLLPMLGMRPIAELRRPELVEAMRKIEERDALNVAKKCRGWLGAIFRYALVSGVIEINHATDLHVVAAPRRAAVAHAHLPLGELRAFLGALEGYRGDLKTISAIRLLLLTAVRPGELRHASWDEFDLEVGRWSIPAERMKMRRPHVVPLPVQAVSHLRALRAAGRGRGFVFASDSDPRVVMSENTIGNAINRLGYKGRQTAHGFRHLVSTALNERGYNRDWIERQLAHGDEDEIRAVYNGAQYFDQRRKMMQAWADEIDPASRIERGVAIETHPASVEAIPVRLQTT